jgi:predicted flap endonuclease-1-like 5' DNA nuclease
MLVPRKPSATLAMLPNLGPESAQWLAAAGITTPTQLRRRGALAAFLAVRRLQPRASLNLLYALQGAVDGAHWIEVRRTRRLELALAVEEAPRRSPRPPVTDELLQLANIGPAMRRDLALLGVSSVRQLARREADALYCALEQRTGQRQDPCVWDTFAAAIHQARTGEARPWWHYTPERKRRQAAGEFPSARPRRG